MMEVMPDWLDLKKAQYQVRFGWMTTMMELWIVMN